MATRRIPRTLAASVRMPPDYHRWPEQYIKKPQGADGDPMHIGDRTYDNDRHKDFDTYFIPTLSVGYSW